MNHPWTVPDERSAGALGCAGWGAAQGDLQWDAILAPLGCPLPELIASEGTMSWPELRTVLIELTQELAAACADGTLPRHLSRALVWVQQDGGVQLADISLTDPPAESGRTKDTLQQRSLALLADVVVLALNRARRDEEAVVVIDANLPAAARTVLERLHHAPRSYQSVEAFLADLKKLPD